MNIDFSSQIIQKLLNWGVAEFCVCAGNRNIPLVHALSSIPASKVYTHFEERSAAFFAVGRIKALGQPVAVVVTSGTAAGELLPAVMEAYYSGLPLVLLTADRPSRYRGCGAPQSAEQVNLFGNYVSQCFDLTCPDDFNLNNTPHSQPLHINVCFDAPLQSGALLPIKLPSENCISSSPQHTECMELELAHKIMLNFLKSNTKPLVILAKIPRTARSATVNFLKKLAAPIYIEAPSNLRENEELSNLQLPFIDQIWQEKYLQDYRIDSVIKIGQTPTNRFWRDLDEQHKSLPVLSISNLPFSGTPDAQHITTNLQAFFDSIDFKLPQPIDITGFISKTKNAYQSAEECVENFPLAEQAWLRHISSKIPSAARVFLGNSLPIRNWDLAASLANRNFHIEVVRGLNGIDGQISTFLGFASATTSNWGIFGDLTALYDQAAPWVLKQLSNIKVNIVIINNGGGMIFDKLVSESMKRYVLNQHEISFEPFAKMWQLDYQLINTPSQLMSEYEKSTVLEIRPDYSQTQKFASVYNG